MTCFLKKIGKGPLDLKPRNENDYYQLGSLLIGKKLAFGILLLAGCLSMAYLIHMMPKSRGHEAELYKSFSYDSFFLKFFKGRAVILGDSGYRAYVGDVEYGMVKGEGKLYDKEGNLIYQGEFDENAYNGKGKLFNKRGATVYNGEFSENLYQGQGRLYREDGTLKYQGTFEKGYMAGPGELYNRSKDLVFTGSFLWDEVMYQEFLGKTTEEGAGMYTGSQAVYETGEGFLVSMRDIEALYCGSQGESAGEEEFLISGIYVLKDKVGLFGEEISEIQKLGAYFGEPAYQGFTYLSGEDVIALHEAVLLGKDMDLEDAEIKTEAVFDDVFTLTDYKRNCEAYISVYVKDEISYTFFSKDKNQGFEFYLIQKE
ncbi:MAG: hypothetical protein HFI77_11880 [Lachnospiraceae bacterium]|nr:hypothetical protein [Lachnospiraceae bacterium]